MPPAQNPKVGGDVQDLPLGPRLVTGIQGRPVSSVPPALNQALEWNGKQWAPTTISAGTPSPLTTKGDIWGYSSVNARIPVGSDTQVLTADSTQTLGVKWATPGTGAMTRVFDSTLASAASTIDTTGTTITGYSHLMIDIRAASAKVASNDALYVTINNDTGAHYSWGQFNTSGAGTGQSGGDAVAPASSTPFFVPGTTATHTWGTAKLDICDYSASRDQVVLGTFGYVIGASNHQAGTGALYWAGAAAITRLAITCAGGNLIAGSRMTIYGLQ